MTVMQAVTVLLVEDDDGVRVALGRLLGASGFTCDAYPSAEALLVRGEARGAVCVVSDLKLPQMSGLELLDTLRAQGGWPPLIMITGHDAPGLREQAVRCGASAYLVKPFQGAELLRAVNTAIGTVRRS